MISIIIAEDNNIVRKGTVEILNRQKDTTVIGEASGGMEVLQLLGSGLLLDVVLADLNMPEMDGISLTREIVSKYPQVKIAIVTMHDKDTFIMQAKEAGAHGYILKDGNVEGLLAAIHEIVDGQIFTIARGVAGKCEAELC